MLAAAATDEGGNFLDVHYGPLTPKGNYHLKALPNIAVNSGNAPSGSQFPNRSPDLDGQVRPSGTTHGVGGIRHRRGRTVSREQPIPLAATRARASRTCPR